MDTIGNSNIPPGATGSGQAPKGGFVTWLKTIWLTMGKPRRLLVLAGFGIILFAVGAALMYTLYFSRPVVVPLAKSGDTAASPSSDSNDNRESGTSDPEKKPEDPPKADAKKPAQNGQQTTPSTGGGSTNGGSSEGSSGGTPSGDSGSTTCSLPSYPSASCTGVPGSTTLAVINGNMDITTAGTVIDGKDIRGCVSVTVPGVIIRNSKISCSNFYVIDSTGYSGARLTIQDSEIHCNGTSGTGIGEGNFTAQRLNIHGCENGFDVDTNVTIEDSYIHDLAEVGGDPHSDGIQVTPVGNNVTIRHNTIQIHGTSAIITPNSVISNILIQDNLLAGGAYTLYCRAGGSGNNFRVINNHFSRIFFQTVGAYGPWTDCDDETQVTGNVYHETGLPVPF